MLEEQTTEGTPQTEEQAAPHSTAPQSAAPADTAAGPQGQEATPGEAQTHSAPDGTARPPRAAQPQGGIPYRRPDQGQPA